jgi:signal transduction histidine kinase
VYVSVLEALQNVAKHSGATHAMVSLHGDDGRLTFELPTMGLASTRAPVPTGPVLQGVADRLGAIDGSLEVRSTPGSGTTIVGIVPIQRSP